MADDISTENNNIPNDNENVREETIQEDQEDIKNADEYLGKSYRDTDKPFFRIMSLIENFNLTYIKKFFRQRREEKEKEKEKEKILKKTETTSEDIKAKKASNLRKLLIKISLLLLIVILVVGAVKLATDWNTLKPRPHIESKHILNTNASFGKIGEVNYFMQQNILNNKINTIQKHNEKNFKQINKSIKEQTYLIEKSLQNGIKQANVKTAKQINQVKQQITQSFNKKISKLAYTQQQLANKINNIKNTKTIPHLGLKNGHVIFPSLFKNTSKKTAVANVTNANNSHVKNIKQQNAVTKYKTIQIVQTINTIPTLKINTLNELAKAHKFKPFYVDLPIALSRVTLLTGCKAPTLSLGQANPVPVLMSIEGNVHLANDYVTDLRGCFLRGAAYGNINTSRAMIFGTHLSCVLVARNGKKYKIEKTFPKGQVWIKGEDGNDGVKGLLVSSDGKILSKAAAMGFMEGFANYFAMQSVPVTPMMYTGTATGGTQANTSLLGSKTIGGSFQNGFGQAMSSSFNIIIKQYEKLLNGYYPYIDVKGGRPNLTAFFGGHMKLKVTPFVDPNIQTMEDNNFALGYKTNNNLSAGGGN